MEEKNTNVVVPTMNVKIINQNGKPAIEIRKVINDLDAMKAIITCAYRDESMVFLPNFNNKALSINRLLDLGLIVKDSNSGEYHFLY